MIIIINSIHLILKINPTKLKINTQQVQGLRSTLVSPSAPGTANCQMHFPVGMKSAKLPHEEPPGQLSPSRALHRPWMPSGS